MSVFEKLKETLRCLPISQQIPTQISFLSFNSPFDVVPFSVIKAEISQRISSNFLLTEGSDRNSERNLFEVPVYFASLTFFGGLGRDPTIPILLRRLIHKLRLLKKN
eukprot:TRINITY_DN6544_c0_g1_i1.p1 TRINITY_DN6544_c0_g1~~TRINITY_DN6544_c0_g1_i1.p1  ORF type:complete len:107 (-),score=26.38 TRINITY_DN6544_c0_g1_i1:49-369(-)